ncbi:MAG: choice-of-anchor Q domain-containing protein [Thermomicrobiales bacterium]
MARHRTRITDRRLWPLVIRIAIVYCVCFVGLLIPHGSARAASGEFFVTRYDDPTPNGCAPADCSLREAVIAANATSGATIYLRAGYYRLTQPIPSGPPGTPTDTPATGDLDITGTNIELAGAGVASTVIDAQQIDRVLDIASGASVRVQNVTLRGGNGQLSNIAGGEFHAHGGAIHNHGQVDLVNVTVSDSTAQYPGWKNGGGIYNAGGATANLWNVSVIGNSANTGGGIENGGDLFIMQASIVNNTAPTGGGLKVNAGNVFLNGGLLAGNGADCTGTLVNDYYDLIQNSACTASSFSTGPISGQNPQLFPIKNSGNLTIAYGLQATSPAIDAYHDVCNGEDELGITRPQDGNGDGSAVCGIGAIEYYPGKTFPDVSPGNDNYGAIAQLTARGIIHGNLDGTYGPASYTLRAQMAALVARPFGWDLENHGNTFTDRGWVDDNLWASVGSLAFYDVARGYQPATCVSRGFPPPCFGPLDDVLNAQVISFITRAMVKKGYWTQVTTDDPALYPNVSLASGHRFDVLTYYYNAGAIPTTTPYTSWTDWNQPATRGWFAQAEWQALQTIP